MTIVITIEDARKVKRAVEIADKILELLEEKERIEEQINQLKSLLQSLGVEIQREEDGNGQEGESSV